MKYFSLLLMVKLLVLGLSPFIWGELVFMDLELASDARVCIKSMEKFSMSLEDVIIEIFPFKRLQIEDNFFEPQGHSSSEIIITGNLNIMFEGHSLCNVCYFYDGPSLILRPAGNMRVISYNAEKLFFDGNIHEDIKYLNIITNDSSKIKISSSIINASFVNIEYFSRSQSFSDFSITHQDRFIQDLALFGFAIGSATNEIFIKFQGPRITVFSENSIYFSLNNKAVTRGEIELTGDTRYRENSSYSFMLREHFGKELRNVSIKVLSRDIKFSENLSDRESILVGTIQPWETKSFQLEIDSFTSNTPELIIICSYSDSVPKVLLPRPVLPMTGPPGRDRFNKVFFVTIIFVILILLIINKIKQKSVRG